ncbi:MAG: phosphoribosylformylglycinamidine synthase subunit PurL [Elusimicrobiota bacterium]
MLKQPQKVEEIELINKTDDELLKISKERLLSLNLGEMQAIQGYYRKDKRNPTDVELETLAQTWSEHCKHKTFRGRIEWEGGLIDDLLKQTIVKVTKDLNKAWCISVFKDNAGIIEFDENCALAFKVETHNHPSALEPYGGAGTGIGGVIRDILGVGLGAKPILNTDVFCFARPDYPREKLPAGVLHPKRIFKGVVAGVRDYGNRMGIPTANGAICFDDDFLGNPLVYCGTLGLIPNDKCFKKVAPGDLILAIGGRTGRDGIHGATFSSLELSAETDVAAVQIGNPIVEKKVTAALLAARDKNLYRAVTDCGAGGFSSAVGEMAEEIGAKVYLDKAPLKYAGLLPWEIWVSEAQERMVFAVPPENLAAFMKILDQEDVEGTVIGEFGNNDRLQLFYANELVADLDIHFLHDGLPRLTLKAVKKERTFPEPQLPERENLTEELKNVLSQPSVASKEWVIRQYDHEVQGATILKPLTGVANDGPSDACVIAPVYGSYKGVAVANGINTQYGKINPYWMAASVIDEAIRNLVCVGADLTRTALLDNFCWGKTTNPEHLGDLVQASQACYDLAISFETPFISGKDSFNNEYLDQATGRQISIPPTLLISAVAVVEDVRKVVTMDVKKPANLIYILGETKDELGGSQYYLAKGYTGNKVPRAEPKKAKKLFLSLHQAITAGLVRSCHDCSEGGLAVTVAEMSFAGGWGMELNLEKLPRTPDIQRDDTALFSESNSRFVVEVSPEKQKEFEKTISGNIFAQLGKVTESPELKIYGLKGKLVISATLPELKASWQKTLAW